MCMPVIILVPIYRLLLGSGCGKTGIIGLRLGAQRSGPD